MSTLNLQLNAIAYQDTKPSNNPSIRTFDYAFKCLGQVVDRPKSEIFALAPGETRTIFDGTRTTAIDGTTEFDITRPDPSLNTYRFTNSAGTAPVFRTDRVPGIDNTSTFSVSINGPLATYTSTGGTALDTTNVVVGDILRIENGSGFNPVNCGRFSVLAKTSTSITVNNVDAAVENITVTDYTKFLLYSNGGANNQIQIGDKVILSAGFSSSSFGTYVITEVTPKFFEIAVAAPNGLALETGVMPGAAGMIFYSAAKRFVMVAAQQKCSVRNNADSTDNNLLEPTEVNNPEKPALYLKNGTTYSLVIKNLSIETLNVLVASAE